MIPLLKVYDHYRGERVVNNEKKYNALDDYDYLMWCIKEHTMIQNKIYTAIRYTLQVLITIFIALEIAIPPNLYTKQLVFCLIIYIILTYKIVPKVINTFSRYKDTIRSK